MIIRFIPCHEDVNPFFTFQKVLRTIFLLLRKVSTLYEF